MSAAPDLQQLESDLAFAREIAAAAGRRVLGLRSTGRWSDPITLGDVGDHAADGLLQGYLRGRYRDDGILSEETADSPERLGKARVWIVDPLDGTKEYRSGREDWAVHVALCIGGRPALGAVGLPTLGLTLWGLCWPGLERVGLDSEQSGAPEVVRGTSAGPAAPRAVCSRSHTPPWVERFAAAIGGSLVPCGSVGFKVSRLLFGYADVYAHKRGLKEWDTCAPECVARAAGWHVSRLDGSPQRYNQPDPKNDELFIARPAAAERLRRAALEAGALRSEP
jgi:3'(2'), 5'-bisphosphate nucleotidase